MTTEETQRRKVIELWIDDPLDELQQKYKEISTCSLIRRLPYIKSPKGREANFAKAMHKMLGHGADDNSFSPAQRTRILKTVVFFAERALELEKTAKTTDNKTGSALP
jgi:hypothetical protein